MTDFLDSRVTETELDKVVMNNDLFEKKTAILEAQSKGVERNISFFDECLVQVKRMTANANGKLKTLQNDTDQLKEEVPRVLKEAGDTVDAAFEKAQSIQAMTYPNVSASDPAFSVTLPLDELLRECQQQLDELQKRLEKTEEDSDLLEIESEEVRNERESTAKSIKKTEKEVAMLKDDLQKRSDILALRNAASSEKKLKLEALNKELEEEEKKREAARKELQESINAEEERSEQRRVRQLSHEVKLRELKELEESISSQLTLDMLLPFHEIKDPQLETLLSEISAFLAENPPLPTSLVDEFPEYSEMNEKSIADLKSQLKKVKKEKKGVTNQLKEMRVEKEKFDVATEAFKIKKGELEELQNKIGQHAAIIKENEVLAKSVHPVGVHRRRSNKQEVLREPSFRVPDGQIIQRHPIPGKRQSIPMTADFTETVITDNSQQYPGIRALEPQDLIASEPDDASNKSGDVFNQDSTLTEETGTTQDEDGFNDFFGQLNNPEPPKPVPVEFSMTQHMADFEKREKEAKLEKMKKTMREALEDEEGDLDESIMASSVKPNDEDDEDLDDIFNETGETQNSSLFSQNFQTPPKKIAERKEISPIMSQRSTRRMAKVNYNQKEEDEEEADEDMEDSLFVPKKSKKRTSSVSDDSQEEDVADLEQTSWGSDD